MVDKTASKQRRYFFSLKSPKGHWLFQRVTAVALVPLSVWLIVLLNMAQHVSYMQMIDWLSSPINALAIAAWIALVFLHSALGVQVVIEDYISTVSVRKWAISGANLIFLLLGFAALAAMTLIFSTR